MSGVSKLNKPVFRLMMFVWAVLLLNVSAHAQVVTAPFDPTQPVLMPAAAAWREASVIGGSYVEQTGSRSLNEQQIYQFDGSGFSGNAVFQISNFFIDGYTSQIKTDAKIEQYFPAGGKINLAQTDNRLNVALTGNDFVTLGLGVRSTDSTDYFDATNDSAKTQQVRTIGSISVKTMDIFFIGAGYERVKETSNLAVDLNWYRVIGGIGMKTGQPGEDIRFRAEFSYAYSPEAENDVQGDLIPGKHAKTTTSRLDVELMFSGLLFAFSGNQTTIDLSSVSGPIGSAPDEMEKTRTSGGVLWIPAEGLMLGFYFANETTTYTYLDERSEFRINLGYLF